MCVGIVRIDQLKHARAEGPGNLLLLVGADTGRDGIHGASFASLELDDSSEERRPAVQVGNPFLEKCLIEALQERSGGALALPTGTVYPALRRLERAGYVDSAWSTVSGRERRTYRLTNAGRKVLSEERTAWQEFTATIVFVVS